MKYRKKPIVIQAFQMTKERRRDNRDWPIWLHRAWQMENDIPGSLYPSEFQYSDGTDRLKICTLEGPHLVEWDDYIIQGIQGELYPCKPDIFEQTYEEVEDE